MNSAPAYLPDEGSHVITAFRRRAGWLALVTIGVGAVNFLYSVALTWLLPIRGYTNFAAVQGLLLVCGTLAAASVPWVLARQLARHPSAEARSRSVSVAVVMTLVEGVPAAAAVAFVASRFGNPAESAVVGISAFLIFGAATVIGYLQGSERFGQIAILRGGEVVLKVAGGLALVMLGVGVLGALAGFGVGALALIIFGVPLFVKEIRRTKGWIWESGPWRHAVGITSIQGGVAVLANIDVVVSRLLVPSSSVLAGYQLSLVLSRIPLFVSTAIAMTTFTRMSARPAESVHTIRTAMGSLSLTVIPLGVAVATIPLWLTQNFLPSPYHQGVISFLPYTASSGILIAGTNLVTTFFQSQAKYRRCAAIMGFGILVDAAAILIGLSMAGLHGLAVGSVVGQSIILVALLVETRRAWGATGLRVALVVGPVLAAVPLIGLNRVPALWLPYAGVLCLLAGWVAFFQRGSGGSGRRPRGGGRLRIVHLAFDDHRRPGSGGGAIRSHEVNRRLARRHEVTAVTVNYPGARPRVEDGVKYVQAGIPLGYFGSILSYFVALPWVAWHQRADLVVEDFAAPIGSSLAPLWTRKPMVGVVQWLFAREKSKQYHLPFWAVERWGVRSHRRLIAVSDHIADQLRNINPGASVTVIPNGVDQRAGTRSWHRGPNVVFLGRLEMAQKGIDLLLQAFRSADLPRSTRLVIAGDGPDRKAAERMAAELGISGRVDFLGRIEGEARFELLGRARLVCMPSRYETFGMVALEAMACGAPVLSFDIDCLKDLVQGVGVLVPRYDVEAYAQAMRSLITDGTGRRRMRSSGIARAQSFGWNEAARLQEAVYLDAVSVAPPTVGDSIRVAKSTSSPATGSWSKLSHDQRGIDRGSPSVWRRMRRPSAPRALTVFWLTVAGGLFAALALGLREFHLNSTYDVFVDEITYLRLGQSVFHHLSVNLYGHPFLLHPAGFFALEALFFELHGPVIGGVIYEVFALRQVNLAFAALTAALLFYIGYRASGAWGGIVAAAIFCVDPFAMLTNSRVLLETSTLFWALLGMAVVAGPIAAIAVEGDQQSLTGTRRMARWRDGGVGSIGRYRIVIAGVAFGLALVTDDFGFFVTLLPLAICFTLNWVLPRRQLLGLAAVTVLPYAIYVGFVWHAGLLDGLLHQQFVGLSRLAGLIQQTGFNRPGGPSFLATAIAEVPRLGASYVVMLLGVLAMARLALRPSIERLHLDRLIAAWSVGAASLIGYVIVFHGTLEEQMFYYLFIGALLALSAAVRQMWMVGGSSRSHRLVAGLLVLSLVALVGADLRTWHQLHTTPDNGYQRVTQWLGANVKPGATISVTDNTSQFLVRGYRLGRWVTPGELRTSHVRYVIVSSKETNAGYGFATPAFSAWLTTHATLVFSFTDRSYGRLGIYRVPRPY